MLDIPGQPAPVWMHHRYPASASSRSGAWKLGPAERYMDNVADPNYRRLVHRLAHAATLCQTPALFAVGCNNEAGNGMVSSRADRQRFIVWLKQKYRSLDALPTPPGPRSAGHAASTPGTKSACPTSTAPAPTSATWTCGDSGSDRHHRRAA